MSGQAGMRTYRKRRGLRARRERRGESPRRVQRQPEGRRRPCAAAAASADAAWRGAARARRVHSGSRARRTMRLLQARPWAGRLRGSSMCVPVGGHRKAAQSGSAPLRTLAYLGHIDVLGVVTSATVAGSQRQAQAGSTWRRAGRRWSLLGAVGAVRVGSRRAKALALGRASPSRFASRWLRGGPAVCLVFRAPGALGAPLVFAAPHARLRVLPSVIGRVHDRGGQSQLAKAAASCATCTRLEKRF